MITKQFLLAGNAIFTIANPKGNRYTFRVNYSKKLKKHFVYLLTGSNNETDYTYMGMLIPLVNNIILTNKSKYNIESLSVKVFNYALKVINGNKLLLDGYFLEHEGRCGKCGRTLTTPESIKSGLGPVCRGKV